MATIGWEMPDALALRIATALAKSKGVAIPDEPTVEQAVAYIKGYVEEEIGRTTLEVEAREAVRAIYGDESDPLYNPSYAPAMPPFLGGPGPGPAG